MAARCSQDPVPESSAPASRLRGTFPVAAIWVTNILTISEVEVPKRLVTLFALSKTGFLIRQRKSTVMLQLCLNRRPFQALLVVRTAAWAPNTNLRIAGIAQLLLYSYL